MSRLNVIFIGPPGSGKGTQASIIKDEFEVCHLSTGDMLRAAVAAGTAVGKAAKAVMEAGGLVSDDIMIGVIKDAIHGPACKKGFILDGFPRTIVQAEALDGMLEKEKEEITATIHFAIDDEMLVKRITGRMTHKPSGRSYNKYFKPPKVAGKDDVTGEPLTTRSDDNEAALRTRLVAYHTYTAPVLGYYKAHNILTRVDASKSPQFVAEVISGALKKYT